MKQLRVFFAGKIDPFSSCAAPFWRSELTWELNQKLTTCRVADTSFIDSRNRLLIEHDLPVSTLFSQSCFYIKHSDVLVVNLTNDISVGGSQEIFIAKQANIPVIGIAQRGGKFNQLKYQLGDKTYWNWMHPFVDALCDLVVHDVDELAVALDGLDAIRVGGLRSVEAAIAYYQRNAAAEDTTVNHILSFADRPVQRAPQLRIYFAGKMGKAAGFSEAAWRDHFAEVISRNSRFQAVNLDFLAVSHDVVDETNGKLIFGRDAYLIRSSDLVVVHLSDDISVGGAVEMMLAKLYHRPLIGVARPGGKFVSEHKELFGRTVNSYVNPFGAATCDWLVHDASELPRIIDELPGKPIKNHSIIPGAAKWYRQTALAYDRPAQLAFV